MILKFGALLFLIKRLFVTLGTTEALLTFDSDEVTRASLPGHKIVAMGVAHAYQILPFVGVGRLAVAIVAGAALTLRISNDLIFDDFHDALLWLLLGVKGVALLAVCGT